MTTRTVQLATEVEAALEREARRSGRSVDDVLNDVVRRHQAQLAIVEAGRADAAAGRTIDNESMKRWFASWGTDDELEPPT